MMARNGKQYSALDEITADLLPEDVGDLIQSKQATLKRLHVDRLRPDPFNPRRILPPDLHQNLHTRHQEPMAVVREWVKRVRATAKRHGISFENPFDLVHGTTDEEETQLPPSVARLRNIATLAVSLTEEGQVIPITVVRTEHSYRIETGARRYYAALLLATYAPNDIDWDQMLLCVEIQAESASVWRQAKENTLRSGLNAVGMARQAALLMLDAHGIKPDAEQVSDDFYRQALDLDMRGMGDQMQQMLVAMGGIKNVQFSNYRRLLNLANEALHLADEHDVSERCLRPILRLNTQDQTEALRFVIAERMSARQVEEYCAQIMNEHEIDTDEDSNTPSRRATKAVRVLVSIDEIAGDELAQAFIDQEKGNHQVARARLDSLIANLTRVRQQLGET